MKYDYYSNNIIQNIKNCELHKSDSYGLNRAT